MANRVASLVGDGSLSWIENGDLKAAVGVSLQGKNLGCVLWLHEQTVGALGPGLWAHFDRHFADENGLAVLVARLVCWRTVLGAAVLYSEVHLLHGTPPRGGGGAETEHGTHGATPRNPTFITKEKKHIQRPKRPTSKEETLNAEQPGSEGRRRESGAFAAQTAATKAETTTEEAHTQDQGTKPAEASTASQNPRESANRKRDPQKSVVTTRLHGGRGNSEMYSYSMKPQSTKSILKGLGDLPGLVRR